MWPEKRIVSRCHHAEVAACPRPCGMLALCLSVPGHGVVTQPGLCPLW